MNGLRANVPAFYPDVAADRAAPQADWQDRRAHVQVHGQRGMTHRTDRHQRPPLLTAAPAVGVERKRSEIRTRRLVSRYQLEGSARHGRTYGTHTRHTETCRGGTTTVSCLLRSNAGNLQRGGGTWQQAREHSHRGHDWKAYAPGIQARPYSNSRG